MRVIFHLEKNAEHKYEIILCDGTVMYSRKELKKVPFWHPDYKLAKKYLKYGLCD